MADRPELTRVQPGTATTWRTRLLVRYRLTPWWGRVILVFALSRIVTTVIMVAFAGVQLAAAGRVGSTPDYFDFAAIWDGAWYRLISESGYPNVLPHDPAGHVTENAWAFMPAYPFVVRIFTILGFPFVFIAPIVSAGFALGAGLFFYKIMIRMLPVGSALFAVVLLFTAPLSPILQVSYAESMALFLVMWLLYLLVERRYWTIIPVAILFAFTRPGALAFAATLLLHFLMRLVTRGKDPFPTSERIAVIVAGLVTAVAGLAWPAIAWAVTGSPTAYTDTELAWRAGYIGYQQLALFAPWFQGGAWWLALIGVPAGTAGVLGAVGVVLLVVGFGLFLLTPWARRLGADIRFWLISYSLYVLAVFFPQSSTFRILVPLAPALGALAVPTSRVFRIALVALGIAGQIVWVYIAWYVNGVDWSPP